MEITFNDMSFASSLNVKIYDDKRWMRINQIHFNRLLRNSGS